MSPLAVTSLQLAACSALILWAGVKLSRYGDMIAQLTGVGGTWIGLLLMAAVTSLPELITGGSAVVLYDATDIAAGDAIGSCMFNLVILALLDARQPVPLSTRVHQGHVLTAGFGIVQLGLVGLAVLAGRRAPVLGWVGLHSLVFIALYVLGMRTIYVFERARLGAISREVAEQERYGEFSLRQAIVRFAAAASLLVAAAAYLPGVGERLADETGLARSFVGSLFIAAATSFPEIVVSAAAARLGAVDMAAANLFGSNLFNVAILGIDDVLYTRGTLLASVAPAHLVTLTAAMMMTAAAIVGLTYRASRKRYRLSWDALAILAIYAVAVAMMHGMH
jgi:cation:H+ antiporter